MVSGLFQERLGDGHFVSAPSVLNPEGIATVGVSLTLGLASFFVIVLWVLGMEAPPRMALCWGWYLWQECVSIFPIHLDVGIFSVAQFVNSHSAGFWISLGRNYSVYNCKFGSCLRGKMFTSLRCHHLALFCWLSKLKINFWKNFQDNSIEDFVNFKQNLQTLIISCMPWQTQSLFSWLIY